MGAVQQRIGTDKGPRKRTEGALPLNPVLGRHSGVCVTASAPHPGEFGRVSLGASLWNEWRPIHLSRADRLGYALAPVFLVAVFVLPSWLLPALGSVFSLLSLVLIRSQQKPYFTSKHLYARRGWLGLTRVAIPLETINDVVVEPVAISTMGTINVRYGTRYLELECVPDADRRADLLRKAIVRCVAKDRSK